jgi:hypothetical protein
MAWRMVLSVAATTMLVLLPSAAQADDAPFGNKLSVAAGFGNHGKRIHVLMRYSIFVPSGCPSMRPSPYDPPEEIKAFWSPHCAAYREQRARLTLRIFRISPPLGLAFIRTKQVHGKLATIPGNPFDTGGAWPTDVYTSQLRTGCYPGNYTIKATLRDPYGRPDFSAHYRFRCR